MKEFFKPTWNKVIFTIALIIFHFFLLGYISSFYSCPSPTPLTLPPLGNDPTPTPTPSILDVTGNVTVTAVNNLISPCPLFGEYIVITGIVTYVLLIVISYVLSCTFVFLFRKIRRGNTSYSAKSKK